MSTDTIRTGAPSTTTVLDVDLAATIPCDRAELCVSQGTPAVTRVQLLHVCQHVQQVLICGPCTDELWVALGLNIPGRFKCVECGREHRCFYTAHVISVTAL